jgi:hypothetical protein
VARATGARLAPQAEEAAEHRETGTNRGELGDGIARAFVEAATDERGRRHGGCEKEAEPPWPATQPERNAVEKRPKIVEDVAGRPRRTGSQTRSPAEDGRRYGNGHDRRGRHREGECRPPVRQATAVLDCIDRDTG